jgi:hypothetical protein
MSYRDYLPFLLAGLVKPSREAAEQTSDRFTAGWGRRCGIHHCAPLRRMITA